MIRKFSFAILSFFLISATAFASNQPYDENAFNAMLKEGKPVVLHIHASWCPVCKAQQQVLDDLLPMPEFSKLTVFKADFDKEKPLLRKYKVRNQSTFIVFKSGKEVERSTGETDSDAIASILKKAL